MTPAIVHLTIDRKPTHGDKFKVGIHEYTADARHIGTRYHYLDADQLELLTQIPAELCPDMHSLTPHIDLLSVAKEAIGTLSFLEAQVLEMGGEL